MGNIVILDDNTINKIAAGEVVDRPASIVKELTENAIDAGATQITIEIKSGGISYIRIKDNGCGFAPDDVQLAFERHATSKIRKETDILKIKSMGFRGEALASIASIAKVTLETKRKEDTVGTKYIIEGGIEKYISEAACNNGTQLTIENVFFNVPARFKFLKKDYTEAGYIEEVVTRIALANPHVAFKYINNGKNVLQTIGNGDLVTVVFSIFGKEVSTNLQKVDYESNNLKVTGVIGSPLVSRSTRQNEYTFVNSRYIKDKTMYSAIEKAFEQNLNIGKFPFAVINLEINPVEVDVNVHPAKLEVKFENESSVFETIYNAIKTSILSYHRATSPFATKEISEDYINTNIKIKENIEDMVSNQHVDITTLESKDIYENRDELQKNVVKEEITAYATKTNPFVYEYPKTEAVSNISLEEFAKNNIKEENIEQYTTEIKYKYVGSIFDTYILIEMQGKLYIIDQHAAHERLIFESIKDIYYSKSKQTQMLLIPFLVELKNSEVQMVNNNMELFVNAGFIIEEFGDNAIKISGVPNIGYDIDYTEMFKDILDEIAGATKTTNEEREKRFVYTIACKAAVKANMKLTREEHIGLIDQMMKLERPFTCPHGRPTAYEISKYEIERRFARK